MEWNGKELKAVLIPIWHFYSCARDFETYGGETIAFTGLEGCLNWQDASFEEKVNKSSEGWWRFHNSGII